jgi:hypothetical protein
MMSYNAVAAIEIEFDSDCKVVSLTCIDSTYRGAPGEKSGPAIPADQLSPALVAACQAFLDTKHNDLHLPGSICYRPRRSRR